MTPAKTVAKAAPAAAPKKEAKAGPAPVMSSAVQHIAFQLIAAPTPTTAEEPDANSAADVVAGASPYGVIVEDGLPAADGQINRTPFMDRVAPAIERKADELLKPSGFVAKDCPYLGFWVTYYRSQSAAHIERAIAKYVKPEQKDLAGIEEAILSHVHEAVTAWVDHRAVLVPGQIDWRASDDRVDDAPGEGAVAQRMGADGQGAPAAPGSAAAIRGQLANGRPLDVAVRTQMERGFGTSLDAVRIHTDQPAAAAARRYGARAFTLGQDVAFAAGEYRPGSLAGDLLLAHELAHTVQQREARSPGQHAPVTSSEPALESDADQAAAAVAGNVWGRMLGFPLDTLAGRPGLTATTGLKLQRCDRPGLSEEEQIAIWEKSVVEQHAGKLDQQPAGVEEQLKLLELSASITRKKAIEAGTIPPAVATAWDRAVRQVFAVRPALVQTGGLEKASRDELVAILEEFYREFRKLVAPKDYVQTSQSRAGTTLTKNPYLSQDDLEGRAFPLHLDSEGILKRLRTASTRSEWITVFADFRRTSVGMDRYVDDAMQAVAKQEQSTTLGAAEQKADAAVAALEGAIKNAGSDDKSPAKESKEARLALYDFSAKLRHAVAPNDYKYSPKAVKSTPPSITNDYHSSRGKELFEHELEWASTAERWRVVIGMYRRLKEGKATFLANPLTKTTSDEGDRLVYESRVASGVYGLLDKHPTAKRIRTIFYPREESERIEDSDFTAQGYPIHLYLYWDSGTWYLVDFTNPDQVKTNDEDGPAATVPVKELFSQLNSRHRFPEGKLYWRMPDGAPWQLETEAKRSVADWLSVIGITAAVLGLALATGGASVAATAFFIASGVAGAGAALFTMIEKSEHGLLTTGDIAVGVTSILAELGSAATAGMGKLVVSGAGKTGTLAKMAVLADKFYIPTVKFTAGANMVSLITISARDLAAIDAIQNGHGSDADKELAKERVVHQLLLMGGISILAMKGQIADYQGGRNLYFDPGFTDKGIARALLKDEELLNSAARIGVRDDAAAVIGRTDLSEDLMLRLRAEVSGAVFTGKRDPAAIKEKLAGLRAASTAEAVELALADLRKLNQQSYQKMLDLFKMPDIEAVLKKNPALRAGLEQNPRLVDLMANDDTIRNVLIKRPEVMESILKHPAAIPMIEEAVGRVNAGKAAKAGTTPAASGTAPKLTTPLSKPQLDLSHELDAAVPKGKNAQPGFDAKKLGDKKYVDSYLDDLYKQAEAAQTELTAVSETIAGATKGQAASRPGPKSRQRSMDKISAEYDGNPARLTDLAGSKIIYRTLDDLYVGLQKAEKELGSKIVYFKDRFINPMESGYRDIQMNVRMANGHVAEFRLHLESIEGVAEVEHAVYELRRSMAPIAKEAGRPLTPAEVAFNQALIETSQRAYAEALAKGMKAP